MKYNFDRIQDAEYCCDMCFLESVIKEYKNLNPKNFESIIIIAEDYLAHEFFRTLSNIRCECGEYLFDFGIVDFDKYDYEGEYIITVCVDGTLSLEQMITTKGNYLGTEGKIIFFMKTVITKQLKN